MKSQYFFSSFCIILEVPINQPVGWEEFCSLPERVHNERWSGPSLSFLSCLSSSWSMQSELKTPLQLELRRCKSLQELTTLCMDGKFLFHKNRLSFWRFRLRNWAGCLLLLLLHFSYSIGQHWFKVVLNWIMKLEYWLDSNLRADGYDGRQVWSRPKFRKAKLSPGSSKTLGMDYLFFLRKTNEEGHCLWRETDVQVVTTCALNCSIA